MSSENFMSFYVSNIPMEMTSADICELFQSKKIGKVERLDFIRWSNDSETYSAFVHLQYWHFNLYTDNLYNALDNEFGSWKLQVYNNEFISLKKMTAEKVPSTQLNIHQLAAKIINLQEEIYELNSRLEVLEYEPVEKTRLSKTGLVMDMCDFVDHYDDCGPLTMADLATQSQSYQKKTGNSDTDSESSGTSAAKRMRNSEELCGNC